MKSYTITVNGTAYEVTVEENGNAAAPAAGAGSVKVSAAVPGKVVKIVASVGQSVKAGDSVVIVESMKMEIPVVAPEAGTIASIDVAVGDAVESGAVLATLN